MFNPEGLLKTVLVALVMVAAVRSSTDVKLASCCKKVTNKQITDPITGYMVQRASPTCVQAVIFQTENGLFCIKVSAPWVRRKIIAFERAKARATPSPAAPSSSVSLLSVITSTATASPPPPPPSSSSSSSPASLASASEAPADE